MSAPLRKGWCPSLAKPMESGDGWLIRVPVRFGILRLDLARRIAQLSQQFGNGQIDLTQRGNLQLRGITPDAHPRLVAELEQIGLAHEPAVNIVVSPLAGIDPACDPQTHDIAGRIEALARETGVTLPPKFLIVVDGGGYAPMDIAADLLVAAPIDLAALDARLTGIFTSPPAARLAEPATHDGMAMLGVHSLSSGYFLGVSPSFGRMNANQLTVWADVLQRHDAPEMRLAPHRAIYAAVDRESGAFALKHAALHLGFMSDAKDPRRNIRVCPGAPDCSSAFGDTRELALQLARMRPGHHIHVSGCAKGCACAAPMELVITATPDGYDIGRHDRAGARDLAGAIARENILARLMELSKTR